MPTPDGVYRPENGVMGKWQPVKYEMIGQGRDRHMERTVYREMKKSNRLFPVKFPNKEEAQIKCDELNKK
jgi:hypothetical protein